MPVREKGQNFYARGHDKLCKFELLERKRYRMSWGPATVFIHRRLREDGSSLGNYTLNLLPSDSITYEDEEAAVSGAAPVAMPSKPSPTQQPSPQYSAGKYDYMDEEDQEDDEGDEEEEEEDDEEDGDDEEVGTTRLRRVLTPHYQFVWCQDEDDTSDDEEADRDEEGQVRGFDYNKPILTLPYPTHRP